MAVTPDGRNKLDVSANLTLVVDTHSGIVINVVADAKTITLPAAVAGALLTVRNGGAAVANAPAGVSSGNKSVAVVIAPNGTDTIGGGGRAAANSNLTNTKATSSIGDEVSLLGVSGAWKIVAKKGIWA